MTPDSTATRPASPVSKEIAGWRRGFWSLFVTQFQGAFSDNVFKFLVIFLVTRTFDTARRDELIPIVLAVFALPFILFSMAGGFLADRFSKRSVTVGVKMAEIAIMALGTVGLLMQNIPFLIGVIFLMSAQSAFFSPSKYGLLPELLPESRLSWGNGILGLGTFVAIIAGGVVAGKLSDTFGGQQGWSGAMLIALAAVGLISSLGINRLPPANPARRFQLNFLGDLWKQLRGIRCDRVLSLAIVGSMYFWFLGAVFDPTILIYGKDLLSLSDTESGILRAALAIGIGLGSVTAGYLSGRKIEYGLVPLGALGLTVFGWLLATPELSFRTVAIYLSLLGFAGGFFIVPIQALIQHRPDPANKGGVIGANAWLTSLGVFLAAGAYKVLTDWLDLNPRQVFFVGSLVTFCGTIYVVRLVPDSLLRLLLWILTHTLYRLRVEGRDNIPERGGALFVCNHLSLADAVLLQASTDRPIRFIMLKGIYEMPLIKPFARIMRAIPISSEQRPRELLQSLKEASDAIKNGDVVCIFAEGQITRIGQLLPFRRGFEKIMKDVDAPIIPVCLDGVWGSIFSYEHGRFLWKMPRRIPFPVTVCYGKPMPASSTPIEVRQAVQELNADAWKHRRRRMRSLPLAFIHTARRVPFRFAMADAKAPKLTFGAALMRTVFLARRLRKVWRNQKMVGVLLPPSIPGALVNLAALLTGRVPVNLNYTVSEETLASCARQCGLNTVVTSKVFLEQVKLSGASLFAAGASERATRVDLQEPRRRRREESHSSSREEDQSLLTSAPTNVEVSGEPDGRAVTVEPVFLEDLAKNPRAGEKVIAFLLSWLLPDRWLEKSLSRAKGGGDETGVPQVSRDDRELSPLPAGEGQGEGPESPVSAVTGDPLDDLATIIFSSGSTGDPKGVMLSHYNIISNIEQLGQTFALSGKDRILGVLPFFHSFGFTGTLGLPAVLGVGVVYHPNPLDAKTIGELVERHGVTFVLATPTFLQFYMRSCAPEQFGSVQFVMVGAEKLPDRLAAAFEEQFGIRPVEGYGCTECAPVVAVNTRDFRAAGFRQVGARRGKIGHPLPGVCVKIVDPDTMQPVPAGQSGLLLVRGPNVMMGYLGRPEKTAEVLRDGWYITGDIAAMDEDGFLAITDRLSRFSKIGGEMVPHIRVEEKLHELAGTTEQTFVVTGVPDEKKGERLVVLHKLAEEKLAATLDQLARSDLPNLWKPRKDQFFRVEALPYLGTGKLDLKKIRELATNLSAASGSKAV